MIYWAPLLHFYQPPTQTHWILDKVCEEAYRPLIDIFRNNPKAKVTVNICATLTDLLSQHGKVDIIKGLSELAEKGQLEFTGSAKFHPILPLIPQDEIVRQIILNNETNHRLFGSSYRPNGFFPPELCYSRDILRAIIETGHQWILLSGIGCPVKWPMDIIHQISFENAKISVLFRDDILSNKISFQNINAPDFLQHLTSLRGERKDIYVITAMDAETFGHHIKNWEKLFLQEVYQALEPNTVDNIEHGVHHLRTLIERQKTAFSVQTETKAEMINVVTISKLLEMFTVGSSIEPTPSSWSTTEDDIKAGIYYPLWNAPDNQIHQLLWAHLKICIYMFQRAVETADNNISRQHIILSRALLDAALHSDQFWWASRRPHWDINLINRGLMQQYEALLNAYKAIIISNLSNEEKTECYYRKAAARDIRGKVHDLLLKY